MVWDRSPCTVPSLRRRGIRRVRRLARRTRPRALPKGCVALGVSRARINTIIDFAGAQKYAVKTHGSAEASSRETLTLTAIYPFASDHEAYVELAQRKARGKIVLALDPAITTRSGRP
jgi:hypothetical protein